MVNRAGWAVTIAAGIASGGGVGAAEVALINVEERLVPEAQVSAEAVLVGLVRPWLAKGDSVNAQGSALGAAGDRRRAEITIHVPKIGPRDICVRVVSADGRYTLAGLVAGPDLGADEVVDGYYDPSYADAFAYSQNQMAVLARPCGAGVPQGPLELTVAAWRGGTAGGEMPAETVDLLVNSFRADRTLLAVEGRGAPVECTPVEDGSRAAFDFRCTLDWDEVSSGAAVTLYRVRGGAMDPPVTAIILEPRGQ